MARSGSVRSRYLLSFLLILVPVIVFAIVLFSSNVNTTRIYINEMRLEQFQNAVDDISGMLARCESAVEDTISLESCFGRNADGKPLANDAKICMLLEKMETRLNSAVEVTLFIRGDKHLYTCKEKILYRDFETQHKYAYDLNGSLMYTTMLSATQPSILRLNPYPEFTESANIFALLVPVPMQTTVGVDAIFIFWFDSQKINSMFSAYLGDFQGTAHIYSALKPALYYESPGAAVPLADVLRCLGAGLLEVRIGGGHYILLRIYSNEQNIIFTLTAQRSWFYQALEQLQETQIMLSILLIASLLTFSILLTRYNYAPIRSLYLEITGRGDGSLGKNELEIIRSYYNASLEKQEALEEQMSGLNDVVADQFIIKLVFGRIQDEKEFQRQGEYAGVAFHYPYHCTVYVLASALPGGALDMLLLEIRQAVVAKASLVACELWQENALCVIVNFDAEHDPAARALEIARLLYQKFRDIGLKEAQLGIGRVYDQPLHLTDSFMEASAVVRLADLWDGNVHQYDEHKLSRTDDSIESLPLIELSLLEEALHRGEKTVALRAIEEMAGRLTNLSGSFLIFRFFSTRIVSLLIEQAIKNGCPFNREYLEILLNYHSSREFMEHIGDAVNRLCTETTEQNRQSVTRTRNELLCFIQENYRRYDLSIDDVYTHLGLPKSQIIAILRECVGLSFSKYVACLRMNEFERLLIHTDRTIHELVQSVGYNDVSSFLRKFKAQEGITPSQYRELYRSQKLSVRQEN